MDTLVEQNVEQNRVLEKIEDLLLRHERETRARAQ